MKKFLLISILVLALSVAGAYAAPNFQFLQDNTNATSAPGNTASFSFTLNNTGTTNLDISFTGYDLSSGSDRLYITSLSNITNLDNGSTNTPSFLVIIPSQQRSGLYTGTLTGTSNASNTDTLTVRMNVTKAYSASTTPSPIFVGSATLNSTRSSTFNITNTGNEDLTSVSFDFSASGFNFDANKSSFTLAFNTTETIGFNVTIPASSSTGNTTLGSIKIVSTELNTSLSSVVANVGGGLEIEDLDVFLSTRDGESESSTDVEDGNKLNFDDKNVGPESELTFNFNIENTFTDEDKVDINDISVIVTILEIDDGDDLEEESPEFDLDPDSSDEVDVILKIPLSVDEGIYDILVEISGEDDEGNEHTAKLNLELDIDKESRDVSIVALNLFPEKIKCSGTATLTTTIKNLGKRLEDDGRLDITNEELSINVVEENIELEEDPFEGDDEFTKTVPININENTKSGTYTLTVKSYVLGSVVWDTKTVDLVVEGCGETAEEEPPEESEETETVESSEEEPKEEITEGTTVPILGPSTTTEVPLTKRPLFWFIFILINLIVIGGVTFFIIKSKAKKVE